MKLTQLLKENEERPLSTEVKKHFLEIVSTYNKYQESMDRKSDIIKVPETLGGITEALEHLYQRSRRLVRQTYCKEKHDGIGKVG